MEEPISKSQKGFLTHPVESNTNLVCNFVTRLLGLSLNIPFRLFSLRTTLKLHWSLSLLIVAYLYYLRDAAWDYKWIKILSLSIIIIASIFLHELGHAVTFYYGYNIEIKEIFLMCLGGATVPSKEPTSKGSEAITAIVGPIVNFIIAGLFAILTLVTTNEEAKFFIALIMVSNLLLAVFNLLPVYPLDGGRVLRSLMSLCCTQITATTVTGVIAIPGGLAILALGAWLKDALVIITGILIIVAVAIEIWRVRQPAEPVDEEAMPMNP
jgi:Zn-dependent protease